MCCVVAWYRFQECRQHSPYVSGPGCNIALNRQALKGCEPGGRWVRTTSGRLRQHWREVSGIFLKVGALNYGGASVGIIQTEVQEKRAWVSKEQFLEGLALVNTLPGPSGIQIGIFLGYSRAGWWGGLLAGLCFLVPGFCILLALTLTLSALWCAAAHPPCVLRAESRGGGDLRHVRVPAGPGGGARCGRKSCSRSPVPWPLVSRHWASSPPCSWRVLPGSPCTARAPGASSLRW